MELGEVTDAAIDFVLKDGEPEAATQGQVRCHKDWDVFDVGKTDVYGLIGTRLHGGICFILFSFAGLLKSNMTSIWSLTRCQDVDTRATLVETHQWFLGLPCEIEDGTPLFLNWCSQHRTYGPLP